MMISGAPSPVTSVMIGAPRKSRPWRAAGKPGWGAPAAAEKARSTFFMGLPLPGSRSESTSDAPSVPGCAYANPTPNLPNAPLVVNVAATSPPPAYVSRSEPSPSKRCVGPNAPPTATSWLPSPSTSAATGTLEPSVTNSCAEP